MYDFDDKELAIVTYNLNPDFKSYVDKYMTKHGLTDKDEAFNHVIVQLYLDYITNCLEGKK